MKRPTLACCALAALVAVFAACGPAEKAYEETTETAHAAMETAEGLPTVAALVAHRVKDYDAWKVVFDEHMPARKAAGMVGHHLQRGADDPNMVYIYFPATDTARLQEFLASDDLKNAMQRAGVEGQPMIKLLMPMSEDHVPNEYLPGIIVMHPVQDYAAWRTVYDEFDAYRRETGIVGHAVDHEVGRPNEVVVYHQANEMETLRTFVDSQELKDTMARAGVLGEPDIRFVEVVDFAEY